MSWRSRRQRMIDRANAAMRAGLRERSANCHWHLHSPSSRCVNGFTLNEYLLLSGRGRS